MAMNGNTLATEIENAIDTLSDADKGDRSKVWQKIANAIVNHITTNATVTGTATSVQSGGSTAPVTGTVS
jgi:hypothetical protein